MKVSVKGIRAHCETRLEAYRSLGRCVEVEEGLCYTHIDEGSRVLSVVHTDTALPLLGEGGDSWGIVREGGRAVGVMSPHLDDRLGVYIALDILPALGIKTDVLLCEGEETGRSTGAMFDPPRQYAYMVEWDRRGEDAVTYCYGDPSWDAALRDAGFRIGQGSFSDISGMEHLGCKGFNIGIGYHQEHSPWCYCDLRETVRQVRRFASFYHKHRGDTFPHSPYDSREWRRGSLSAPLGWDEEEDPPWWDRPYRGRLQYIDGIPDLLRE